MDNELGLNDPYRDMQSGEKDIRPGFLSGKDEKGGKGAGVLSAAETAAGAVMAAKGGKVPTKGTSAGGAGKSGGAKNALTDGLKSDTKKEGQGGLYNKSEKSKFNDDELNLKMPEGMKIGLKLAAPLLILVAGLLAIFAFVVAIPVLIIGALDYNFINALGFGNTIAILEKVGEFVTAEFMVDGEMPSEYASSLAANGIDVGQVLANGDFVKTNTYIADIETRDDLVAAAGGFSYISDDEGELAMLYDGKIIRAEDFVAEVESTPVLYAAYSASAALSTKYYYGDDVEKVLKEMELSRGNFNEWKSTGDYKKDRENYFKFLGKTLNSGSEITVSGYFNDKDFADNSVGADSGYIEEYLNGLEGGGTYTQKVSGISGEEVTSAVAENTKEYIIKWGKEEKTIGKKVVPDYPTVAETSQNATKRAAELVNNSISSGEPYLAANAFIATEEPIQRARVEGSGLVNIVMNTLSARTSASHQNVQTDAKGTKEPISYQNVQTGAKETKNLAILETKNFRAVVSDSKYSKEEAENFSRDRVLKITGQADKEIIQATNVSAKDKKQASTVVRNGKLTESADAEVIAKAADSIDLSQASKNSSLYQSVVGGNRIIEGGSFLSNTINMQVIGAMPSDNGKITAYHKEVEEAMARQAEADRATRSPFDISSPNTFMGSIVHNMATTILGNYNGGMTVLSAMTAAGGATGNAIANLTGSANAAGSKEFVTTYGDNCETVGSVSVEGDLYCTSHNTPSTKYINYTMSDFKSSEIGGDIGDDGSINEGTGLWEFVHFGMDRYPTVGVRSAEVCERYREAHPDGVWGIISNFFSNVAGTYNVCEKAGDEELQKIATGAKYTFGAEGSGPNELYSSYVMYDEVRSLLKGTKSAVGKSREEYQKKHPLDNSEAGIVARRSGMTKYEATIALAYADYLTEIAMYNPASRFDFTAPVVSFEKPILEYHSDEMALELYAWYSKQAEYDDLRTRNFVV